MTRPTALIFGISGQDGSYLAELLLARDYRVVGTSRERHCASADLERLAIGGVDVREVNLRDTDGISRLIGEVRPDEIYNLAAFSTGTGMFDDPVAMGDVNGLAVVRILSAMRTSGQPMRFCQASSAEMFRGTDVSPQDEKTPLAPVSPYGVAKCFAHQSIATARRNDGLFACSAILFNHESPRRSLSFVTRKVTRAAAEISLGLRKEVALGELGAQRDWSDARDVVQGMWLMLQQPRPADYVLATGRLHSVSELCEIAFSHLGLDWRQYVIVDPKLVRAAEGTQLVGDASLARTALGWEPRISFERMIEEMVESDRRELESSLIDGESTS